MYEIKNFEFYGEEIFILNKGNIIASMLYKGKESHMIIYEKNLKYSDYELNQEITFNSPFDIIALAVLSNEMIIASGRKFIIIFKKDNNSKYYKHQEFFNEDWAEVTNIKELNNVNEHFAVCGFYGLILFKKQNDKYEITFDIGKSILGRERIIDFMKIKGKEKAFILCGINTIFITSNKNILNKINFHENDRKLSSGKDYICEFNDELFLISGQIYITIFNTKENKFKQIRFLNNRKNSDSDIDSSKIYKYDINTIILLTDKEIFIIQIFDNEKIQINMTFCIPNIYDGFLKFIKEEKSVYFKYRKYIKKLTFNNKMKYK